MGQIYTKTLIDKILLHDSIYGLHDVANPVICLNVVYYWKTKCFIMPFGTKVLIKTLKHKMLYIWVTEQYIINIISWTLKLG